MILGLDPALASIGYCVASGTSLIDHGLITTSKDQALGDRLVAISRDLHQLLLTYSSIQHVAIEKPIFVGSRTTAMPVLMAYGVIIHTITIQGLKYTEYQQASWKKQFTGNGKSDKHDVRFELETRGHLIQGADDIRDAVAIALNHLDQLELAA